MKNTNIEEEKLSKQVSVRFTESQYKRIQKMAESKDRKEADLIRILTLSGIEQYEKMGL